MVIIDMYNYNCKVHKEELKQWTLKNYPIIYLKVANLHYAIQDGYYFQEEKDIDDELEELEAIIETINDDIRDLDNLIAKIGG